MRAKTIIETDAERHRAAGITVSEIADSIRRPGEDLQGVIDRLRNWTKQGLLRPLGEKNPGTGQKRRYPETAIIDALVLSFLTERVKMPAVRATGIDQLFESARKSWRSPTKTQQFIVISLSQTKTSAGLSKPEGLAPIFKSEPDAVHIVIDLNHLLERLKKGRGDHHRG